MGKTGLPMVKNNKKERTIFYTDKNLCKGLLEIELPVFFGGRPNLPSLVVYAGFAVLDVFGLIRLPDDK